MSSIAKANISLSKKDLTKSRIPLVSSRNIAFYHKATVGSLSINLLALSMPSEMPTMVQATADEISGARLLINKKNLSLVSSANGPLIQGMDYVVTSSTTIQLIGLYEASGAESGEIFVGTINSAPVSDIVVASARSVDKTYTLAVGQTTLNLGREYEVGMNPNDDIGSIKVFVNGVLAHRDADYAEVDSGSGYGTTISFFAAPVSIPYQVAVDFGVMSISDNDAIGTIESLSGAVIKIAADLADVAGTNITDYLTANPSEVERRAFGDMVLDHEAAIPLKANLNGDAAQLFNVKNAVSANNATALGQFDVLLAASGYQKLPSGLIIQWGSFVHATPEGSGGTITFPISFPNACVSVTANDASGVVMVGISSISASSFNCAIYNRVAGASVAGGPTRYIAIGY
jgi:hypothetical protein